MIVVGRWFQLSIRDRAEMHRKLLFAYLPDWPICSDPWWACSDCRRKAYRIGDHGL